MTSWPGWAAAATLIFAALAFGQYFSTAAAPLLVALPLLGVLLVAAAGSGRVAIARLGLSDVSESQKTLVGATLGLGLLALGVFLLAACQFLNLGSVLGFVALLWLVGASEIRPVLVSLGANRNLLRERPLAAAALIGALALSLWLTAVPPHQYDSLVYHLPLPAAYLRHGGFARVESLLYAHFPQNGEMLYTLALALRCETLAQMLMWLALALSVGWIFELGKREAPLSAVLLACLLLATHTAAMLLSSITYVEPLVMLWTTAAVMSFLRWQQLDAASPGQRSWLALSALFTGLALGTKYYAGIVALLLSGALLWRLARAPAAARRERLLDLGLFFGLTTALFTPWIVKNALMAGNPFFPFFNKLFPGLRPDWNGPVVDAYFSVMEEYRGVRGLSDILALPRLLLTNDIRFGKGMDVLGTLGWDILFWSAPLAVWAGRRNAYLRWLLGFSALYLAAWAATGVVLRFLLPLAPLLCLLAACGLHALAAELSDNGRRALWAGVGAIVLTHLMLFFFVEFTVYQADEVLLGGKERGQFLAERLAYYPCARKTGDLEQNAKILIVGEQRSYFVERALVAASIHAPNPFILWSNRSASPAELASAFSKAGFTHLMVVPGEFRRLAQNFGPLTEQGKARLEGVLTQPVFQAPGCALYKVPAS